MNKVILMKNKLTAAAVAMTLVLSAGAQLPSPVFSGNSGTDIVASAENYNGFDYVSDSGMVRITGYSGNAESITIPAEIDGEPVARFVIQNNTKIKEVTIEDGIGSIGESAFEGCTALETVHIPDSVGSIGWFAFMSCISLKNITIPDRVWSIGNNAFDGCSSLTEINIPAGLWASYFGNHVFHGCKSLKNINVPSDNPSFSSVDGVLYSKDRTELIAAGGAVEKVTVPDETEAIREEAFKDCPGLTEITLPEGLQTIGKNALYNCPGLKELTVPKSVSDVGSGIGFYFDTGKVAVMKLDGFVLKCYSDSAAHEYAESKDIEYILLDAAQLKASYSFRYDKSAVPSEASVKLTDTDGITAEYTPDDDGILKADDLKAGKYTLSVKLKGYPEDNTEIELRAGETTEYSAELYHYGDVNTDGSVNMQDIALLQQSLAGWDVKTNEATADMDADDTVTLKDLALLQQYNANWEIDFK